MQTRKRGNGYRQKKRRQSRQDTSVPAAPPVKLEKPRLTLHDTDPITGYYESLSSLFYEFYRGYTIYSTEQGRCCIHGRAGGCLRINGKYAAFPDIEQAKNMIKYFQANGRSASESMFRFVPPQAYISLNRRADERRTPAHAPAGYSPYGRRGEPEQQRPILSGRKRA